MKLSDFDYLFNTNSWQRGSQEDSDRIMNNLSNKVSRLIAIIFRQSEDLKALLVKNSAQEKEIIELSQKIISLQSEKDVIIAQKSNRKLTLRERLTGRQAQ
jgi:hypothetical protein